METTLSGVYGLTPVIASRSEEIESERRIPDDLISGLAQAGCFRMLAPASHGGDEMALPDVLRVIEALARADGATGWTTGQVASAQLIFAYFPATAIDEFYADGPDLFGAGAVAPKGRAIRKGSGWEVTGQWPFVTGCQQASWLYMQCVVIEEHKMQFMRSGMPLVRMLAFPASEVEILDTWNVSGLRGTASHDIRVSKAFCPEERSAALIGGNPTPSGAIFRIPPLDQGGLFIAAVALGIAQGAIDEVAQLAAGGKYPAFSRQRLAESPLFQDRLGEAHTSLRAARALLYSDAETTWATVTAGGSLTIFERASLRAIASQVTTMAASVVDTAYTLAGGSAVYDSCPLQRRLRDIHAATQHSHAGRHYFGVVGAMLASEEVDETLF